MKPNKPPRLRLLPMMFALVFLFSGCSLIKEYMNEISSLENGESSAPEESPEPSAVPTPEPTPTPAPVEDPVKRIGLIQFTDQPSYSQAVKTIQERLDSWGYTAQTLVLDSQNASGNSDTAKSICQGFVTDEVDLIIAIGPDAAAEAMTATIGTEIDVIFSAVENPAQSLGILEPTQPAGNTSGIAATTVPNDIIQLILDSNTTLYSLGILYNPAETVAAGSMDSIHSFCAENYITVFEEHVTDPALAPEQVGNLAANGVNALFIPFDITVATAMPEVVQAAKDYGLPLYACDRSWVEAGALGSISADYVEVGLRTADMAVAILQGQTPAQLPIETLTPHQTYINADTLSALGITFPEDRMPSFSFYGTNTAQESTPEPPPEDPAQETTEEPTADQPPEEGDTEADPPNAPAEETQETTEETVNE